MRISSRPQILVFGEALVDRFNNDIVPGGAPFNVARHLSAFGLDVLMLTRVGKDAPATQLRAEMKRYGLDELGLQIDAKHETGAVDVIESQPGKHEFRIAPVSAYDFYDHHALLADSRLGGYFRDPDPLAIFYYGTLALRHDTSRQALHHLLDALPAQRFLDFNWRAGHIAREHAWQALQKAEIAKVNDEELSMLLAWQGLQSPWAASLPEAGMICETIAKLLAPTRISALIVTYGAHGYAAFSRRGGVIARGTAIPDVAVRDTVGAGDAFSAITLLGTQLGWPLGLALQRANSFAAAICEQRGAVPDDPGFYARWRDNWQLSGQLASGSLDTP